MYKRHRCPRVVMLEAVYFKLRFTLSYRDVEELNNIVEQDHRNIKRRIGIATGFKEFESAQRTLSGIEVVSVIKKNQIKNSRSTTLKTFISLAA